MSILEAIFGRSPDVERLNADISAMSQFVRQHSSSAAPAAPETVDPSAHDNLMEAYHAYTLGNMARALRLLGRGALQLSSPFGPARELARQLAPEKEDKP